MKIINEFEQYLKNIKNFSINTVEIYIRYIKILIKNENDYKKLLIEINSNSNNRKRIALSAVKLYYKYTKDDRVSEIELPKKLQRYYRMWVMKNMKKWN